MAQRLPGQNHPYHGGLVRHRAELRARVRTHRPARPAPGADGAPHRPSARGRRADPCRVARAPEIAENDINVMFQTNVTGLINMTQAILPIFKARPEGGAGDIINIGSIAGREPYPGGSIYCATKAAVRAFSDSLRKELIDTRIRVMEVDPGQVETEFSVVRFYGDKSKADAVYAGCDPLTPEDIAEVVVFVAGRRQNVVIADTLIFPSHQAGAGTLHRKT
ncbi:hypothetical protein CHGG_04591 [Chaetomium globosum CBS 148.51]|uniref:Oxidoreductase n=1 Tax=Chaetomium globosum (strain ATCC 6205 / CBS 148.51 / DSM 1962 / NBRC 6347 / NRRL 1970) TaxID=306901 RepID=Q2H0V5_CHAGB|nr:uncharacterized protein CHGG_04591 [Chaetomium globosum CBS 148.51]EAQ87972.1 hypothetical protein CHGG_04591 [Chaetomium globosum CBS 148.51]